MTVCPLRDNVLLAMDIKIYFRETLQINGQIKSMSTNSSSNNNNPVYFMQVGLERLCCSLYVIPFKCTV